MKQTFKPLVFAASLAIASSLSAADYYWTGDGSSFSAAANWSST